MHPKQPASTPFWKVLTLISVIIIADLILLTLILEGRPLTQLFIPLMGTIGINLVCFVRLAFYARHKVKLPRSTADLTDLLDQMPYIQPHVIVAKSEMVEETVVEASLELNEAGEPVHVLKPKKIIPAKAVFDKPIQPVKYCDDLHAYLIDNGLAVDKNSVREMLAALATSKLILVCHETTEISERFVELFLNYLGIQQNFNTIPNHLTSFEALFHSDFTVKSGLENAYNQLNRLHALVFKSQRLSTIQQVLNPWMDFAINPLLPMNILNQYNQTVPEIPLNIWSIVLSKPIQSDSLTEAFIQGAVVIDLSAKLVVPKDVVTENAQKLSYDQLTSLLFDGYELHYIEESEWKKIDQIEIFINAQADFKIDNRLFRQLERFTSTYMMFGGEKTEAMDSVLYSKLLRCIERLELQPTEEQSDLLTLFDKLFGLEYLTKSKLILKQLKDKDLEQA